MIKTLQKSKKKSGYALFITIFLIFTMSIIISQMLDVADKSLHESSNDKNYLQLRLLTKDIITILKKSPELKEIKDADDFSNMLKIISYMPIPLSNDKTATVSISSASTRININNIKNYTSTQKNTLLDYLRTKGMLMPDFFYNLLTDLLNPKSNLTDIKRDMPSINAGFIVDWREFDKIKNYYISNTHDYSILSIPWKKLITFNGNKLNANYIDCEMWTLLLQEDSFLPITKEICSGKKIIKKLSELGLSDEKIVNLKKFGLSTDVKTIDVSIKLQSKDKKDIIISTFVYGISLKKVSDVSMAL